MGTIKKNIEEAEGLCAVGWAEADGLDTAGAKESFKMIEKELATLRRELAAMESEWRREATVAAEAAEELWCSMDKGDALAEEAKEDALLTCADRLGILEPNVKAQASGTD